MSKKLVAYFSASGVTEGVARTLAEAADADLYEIRPQVPYTRADLDWTDKSSRSTLEMNDPDSRPAIIPDDPNLAAYDTVFLGFPIWWYVAPTIINTFLEQYDFSGKTVILFATSGGSGFGDTAERLLPSLPADAVLKEGAVLRADASAAALSAWVDSL